MRKAQTQRFMVVQFCKFRTLVLFLVFVGSFFQFPLSPAFAKKSPDEILVGVHRNFPPQCSLDNKTGKPTGFAIDIMDEVARRAGLKVRYVVFDEWPPIFQALKEGRIDIIPNVGIIEERKNEMDFTGPVDAYNISIFVRETTRDIHSIDDLPGRNVAVVRDNSGLFIIQKYGKAKPVIFNSLEQALLSLLSGHTDALVYPELPVVLIVSKSKLSGHVKTVGEPLLEVKRAIAVGKGKTALLNKLDKAVKELIPTQEYKKIYARWYVAPAPYWDVGWLLILAGGVLAFVIVVFTVWRHLSLMRLNRYLKYALEEQKKAEEMLRENEARLKVALTPIDIAVFNQDLDLRYTWIYRPQLGCSTEQAVGKTDAELLPPDAARHATEIKRSVLETATGARGEVEVALEDRTIYYDLVVEPLHDTAGQMVGITGASLDITERKRSEQARRVSEEQFRTSVDNMMDPFGMYSAIRDQSGKIVDFQIEYINTAACLSKEMTQEAQIGKRLCELLPVHRETGLFDEYCRVVETGQSLRKDSLIYSDSYGTKGLTRTFDISAVKLGDGFAATWRDITERKQAEEKLRVANAYNRSLIEASIDPLVTISPDGRITDVNAATERMIGYTRNVLIGTDFSNYFSDTEMARVGYRRVFTEGHVRDYPLDIRHCDGRETPVLYNATLYHNEKGEVSGIFAAARDITIRKRAEEALQASLREKDILLNEVHHRVKNNLQVISSLLKLQARASKNPEVIKGFHESQDRIRAMAMVHEKLYNSKDFTRIDLADYVRSLAQELFQLYSINPGEIDLIIQTDGEVYVDIDKAIPCGLILNELISNALKHAFSDDEPGKLQIIIHETKDTEIEIVVRDNGIGLPDDVDIQKPRSVGLHLVNGLVKNQLNGQIEVKQDDGTEFRITFP